MRVVRLVELEVQDVEQFPLERSLLGLTLAEADPTGSLQLGSVEDWQEQDEQEGAHLE